MSPHSFWLLLSSAALLLPAAVHAEPTFRATVEHASRQDSQMPPLDQQRAADWGLQQEEWQRYRRLMEGPLGVYSPNLDPLTALGIEARDAAEQERYAQKQVQAEYARLRKLMDYQRAYDQAYKRLYADRLPVNLIGAQPAPLASAVRSPHRLNVFVTTGCKDCPAKIRQLQGEGQPFDLFLIDAQGSDSLIREWASKAGIDPEKVRHRQITLNHDAGHWARLGDKGTFPAVMRSVNGQWRRQ
ncbi:TIGR03759 family integrating conjugative element protein [Pseudomonas asplenii]|uniref:TIGR03759 family integrating conjugative element protein n=1 Tax=Pseudomonas asplenii TaxID=53407 RepID=UPI00036B04EB|nr:TIGR03759 family integrating conjugative element protein [Pseudomonas fuscovaginae]